MIEAYRDQSFDIILEGGQSNGAGWGVGPAEHPFEPNEKILALGQDNVICLAREELRGNEPVGNLAHSFCTAYLPRLTEARKILLVKAAVGGTGFLDHHWGLAGDCFLRMLSMSRDALALNPENRLVAFLWHQGENEVVRNVSKETHFENLSALLKRTREELNCPALPFLAGDFVPEWTRLHEADCQPIAEAMRAVCAEFGPARFVETDALTSNGFLLHNQDVIHFSRNSLNLLGLRYYRAFEELVAR